MIQQNARRRWKTVSLGAAVVAFFVAAVGGHRLGYYDALRGGMAQNAGHLDAALVWFGRAYAKNPEAFMVAHDIACCHALKGDQKQCFIWLETALNSSYGGFAGTHAKSEKDFASVRETARFKELLAAGENR